MNNEEMDIYIKSKIKDNHIPERIDNLFNNSAKIIENKGEKQMEENLKLNQNQEQNNNNQKKPENKKRPVAFKRVLATAACLTLLLGGGNIYASTQGYDNIFFLIAEKLGISLDVFGKENILSDRDITISYRPIEIAKGTQIQINNLVIKDNQAKLKLQVKSSNVKNTLAPLRYIVKDENGSELCNYTSAHTQSNVDYKEEIILNNYKEETKKLELQILKSNNTSIVKLEIDLENKKIKVIGTAEELTKISEEELKQYLGAFAMLNYTGTEYNIKMTENEKKIITALLIAESKAINVDAGLYTSNNKDVRRVIDKEKVHAIIESFTDLELNENGIMDFTNSEIFENLTFKEKFEYLYKLDTLGCSPTVMEVTNIDFIGGIYNVTFKFCYSTEENKGFGENSIEDLPIYEMSMGLILDDDNQYSKYRVSTMSEVRLVENEEGLKAHTNKEYIYMRESYDVEINDRGEIFKDKIEIPYININSEDAKKANQEIYKMYEEAVKTVVEEEQENSYTNISYKYSIFDNIISLCIDSTPICIPGGGFTSERTVYNFSLTDGKRLSTNEVLSKLNLTEENMIEKINLKLKDWYTDIIRSGVLGDITEKEFYKSLKYNFNAIYFETNTIAEVYFFENPFNGGMSEKINIFSDTDAQKVIQGFLNIERNYFGSPSAVLTIDEFGYVEDITEYEKKSSRTSDGWLVSNNIKYSDFKNKMLEYMTEELYQEEFKFYKDVNGFLAVNEQVGKPGNKAKVENIELVNVENNVYTYLVEKTNYYYNQQSEKEKEKFELKKKENGKYVVSNWGWKMEVKEALQNYLDLFGAYQGSPVNLLVKLNLIKSADIDYSDKNNDKDGYVKTNIKYSEYKQKMLNYVSESWFNERFTSLYKEKDGYLCYFNGGATGMEIKVESIGSFLNDKYTATVYNIGVDGDKSDTYIKKFNVEYKEKYVISYCD